MTELNEFLELRRNEILEDIDHLLDHQMHRELDANEKTALFADGQMLKLLNQIYKKAGFKW